MSCKAPQVLVVGRAAASAGCLRERLQQWGCECQFANSFHEARSLVGAQAFDLVLSEFHLEDGTAYPLIALARGSRTTVFFSQAVEDSCWWVPAVRRGRECLGANALRPQEFSRVLDEVLQELAGARAATAVDEA